jgi:hypothetical protein
MGFDEDNDNSDDFIDYFEDEGDLRSSMEFYVDQREEKRSHFQIDFSTTVGQQKQSKQKQNKKKKNKNKNKNNKKNQQKATIAASKTTVVVVKDTISASCLAIQLEEIELAKKQYPNRISIEDDDDLHEMKKVVVSTSVRDGCKLSILIFNGF